MAYIQNPVLVFKCLGCGAITTANGSGPIDLKDTREDGYGYDVVYLSVKSGGGNHHVCPDGSIGIVQCIKVVEKK